MKILLDECVDQRLAADFLGYEVRTVAQMAWKSKKNGELMMLAAGRFDVLVTTDRNLSYQQSISKYNIALLVLKANSNRLAELRKLVPEALRELAFLQPGQVRWVGRSK